MVVSGRQACAPSTWQLCRFLRRLGETPLSWVWQKAQVFVRPYEPGYSERMWGGRLARDAAVRRPRRIQRSSWPASLDPGFAVRRFLQSCRATPTLFWMTNKLPPVNQFLCSFSSIFGLVKNVSIDEISTKHKKVSIQIDGIPTDYNP